MPVDKKLVKQLKDQDPQVRRKAIVALANSADPDAVAALADVARSDAEPKLRALAERAQNHIQEQQAKAEQAAAQPEAQLAELVQRPVTEKDIARAKSYMSESLDYYINKDLARASASALKALKANPNLKTDHYFLGMIGNIFNTSQDEALAMLLNTDQRKAFAKDDKKNQIKRKKDAHYAETAKIGWASVWFDLGVFTTVITLITFLMPLVVVQMITRAIEYDAQQLADKSANAEAFISPGVAKFTETLGLISIPSLLIASVIIGVATAISVLIYGAVIHLIASRLLGGKGTMSYMMCQILPFLSWRYLFIFIWWTIGMGLIAIGAGIIGLICMAPMSLMGLYILFNISGKIGKAYDFGLVRGCLSFFFAQLAISLLAALPGLVFGSAFQSMLMGMMASA
jgi:hypothetical protein